MNNMYKFQNKNKNNNYNKSEPSINNHSWITMQLQLDSALTPLCRPSLRVQFMDKTFILMWTVDFKAHLTSS
jgi:hypothetical protein